MAGGDQVARDGDSVGCFAIILAGCLVGVVVVLSWFMSPDDTQGECVMVTETVCLDQDEIDDVRERIDEADERLNR